MLIFGGRKEMSLSDGVSCRCRKCGDPHNNVSGTGYCLKCERVRRLFRGKLNKKLEGVFLPN